MFLLDKKYKILDYFVINPIVSHYSYHLICLNDFTAVLAEPAWKNIWEELIQKGSKFS